MTRNLSATNLSALEERDILDAVTFLKIELDSLDILLHNHVGNIQVGSDVYEGVGALGRVSDVVESTEITSEPLTVELAASTDELVSIVKDMADSVNDSDWRGRKAEVFLGIPDTDTQILVDDPFIVFSGEVSHLFRTFDMNKFDLSVVLVRRLADWSRKNERRFTDAEHQSLYPGDKFFEFGPAMETREIPWRGQNTRFAGRPTERIGGRPSERP